MPEAAATLAAATLAAANLAATDINPGRRVEVRNRYDERWTRGFEVVEIMDDQYVLRRLSDGAVLPTTFGPDEVRKERRPGLWWA
jgi:hypothetical protein